MEKIPAVIPAAGHGSLDGITSKLLIKIGGMTVIARVVEAVMAADLFHPIIVVINTRFGDDIQNALGKAGYPSLQYAHQRKRRGVANAVMSAVPILRKTENPRAQSFLAVLGEMLFMRAEVLKLVVNTHLEHQADFTFLTCPFHRQSRLCNYLARRAYLVRGMGRGFPDGGSGILGGVYALKLATFQGLYQRLTPEDKGDGFGPEYRMPAMIEVARLNPKVKVINVESKPPEAIFSIEDARDLRIAQGLVETLKL